MNDIVKLCLFYSYYGNEICDKFVPFGYSNMQKGLRNIKVKDLVCSLIDRNDEELELWNPSNGALMVKYDKENNKRRTWVEDEPTETKFDIDYWLDRMVDNV